MGNLTQYFERRAAEMPKPKYNIGDRVYGKWNKIPFVASVLREESTGVLLQTDLPVKHDGSYHTMLN
jgi:hypothetical protein